MRLWIKILAGAVPGGVTLAVILLFLWSRRRRHRLLPDHTIPQFTEAGAKLRSDSLGRGLRPPEKSASSRPALRFHHHNRHHRSAPFHWKDHPHLVVEAVETGWPRFAFSAVAPGPDAAAESSWEVPLGSSEFMQTVRLNPQGGEGPPALSGVRMSLPLPGPPLGGGGGGGGVGGGNAFPQEAYFEITILYLKRVEEEQPPSSRASWDGPGGKGGDWVKLIKENSIQARSDALMHAIKGGGRGGFGIGGPIQAPGTSKDQQGKSIQPFISLGLTVGGGSPVAVPGTYPGSIAFNSTGSVSLDGMKLISESERAEWAAVNRVVGCGYDPVKKKVYFTMDSQLMHTIHCHAEAYESPLYPVLTANTDVMVLVNLGQGRFKYAPTNAHRTPNPSFFSPSSGAAGAASEDSRDLFSMRGLDVERNDSGRSNGDTDADSDLFEIPLHS